MKTSGGFFSKLLFTSKSAALTPAPLLSAGDPQLNGGSVFVYNTATGEVAVHFLSQVGWKHMGPAAAPTGYVYKGRLVGDPNIRLLKLRAGRLLVKGVVSYTLDEPAQDRLEVRIGVGGTQWCGSAPAKTAGNPPSSARFDQPRKFIGQRKAPAPISCAPFPEGAR